MLVLAPVLLTISYFFSLVTDRYQELSRIDASATPVTGKFLIGSIPCMITFSFENDYSYFREKVVSYKVTVKPPSLDTLKAGRRRRATACLKAVQEDSSMTLNQLERAKEKKNDLQSEVETLKGRLEKLKNELAHLEVEETTMKDRVELRQIQSKELSKRLKEGWDDEEGLKA
jgi:hypothetical protein